MKELDPDADIDQDSLTYTQLPVPGELTVRPSHIPDAGLGVFAKEFIPRGVKFGPYEGRRVEKDDMGDVPNTAYSWEVGCHCNMLTDVKREPIETLVDSNLSNKVCVHSSLALAVYSRPSLIRMHY